MERIKVEDGTRIRLQGEGEGLDGADHDLLAARQRFGQLGALAAALALALKATTKVVLKDKE